MGGCKMEKQSLEAIALRYRQAEDEAPIVLAKGRGLVAEAILELARQAQIPTVADPELCQLLDGVEVGGYIPREAYQLTAEILAFLWQLETKAGKKQRLSNPK
jgi:flagellar biosynthesis protein